MEDPSMSVLILPCLVNIVILLPATGRGSYACPANALAARIGHSNVTFRAEKTDCSSGSLPGLQGGRWADPVDEVVSLSLYAQGRQGL